MSGFSTLITDGFCRSRTNNTNRNYSSDSTSDIETKHNNESTNDWNTNQVQYYQNFKTFDNIIDQTPINETQQNGFVFANDIYNRQYNNPQNELKHDLNANYTNMYDYNNNMYNYNNNVYDYNNMYNYNNNRYDYNNSMYGYNNSMYDYNNSTYDSNNKNKNRNDEFSQLNTQDNNSQDELQHDLNSTIPTPPPPPVLPVFDPSKQIVESNQKSKETVIEKNYNEEKPAISMEDQIRAQWEKMQRKKEGKRSLQENIDDTEIKPVTPAKKETQQEAMRRQLEEQMKKMKISKNNNINPINNNLQKKSDNNNKVQSYNVKQKEQLEKLNNIYNNMTKSIMELKELSTNIIKNQVI